MCFQIEMQMRKGEPIPSGWAQDPDGNPTNDAELVRSEPKNLSNAVSFKPPLR